MGLFDDDHDDISWKTDLNLFIFFFLIVVWVWFIWLNYKEQSFLPSLLPSIYGAEKKQEKNLINLKTRVIPFIFRWKPLKRCSRLFLDLFMSYFRFSRLFYIHSVLNSLWTTISIVIHSVLSLEWKPSWHIISFRSQSKVSVYLWWINHLIIRSLKIPSQKPPISS